MKIKKKNTFCVVRLNHLFEYSFKTENEKSKYKILAGQIFKTIPKKKKS